MRKANIKGALVGVEAVTPEGLKAVLQGLELFGRGLGEATADVQTARRSCAGFVHLRTADGPARHFRRDGGDGAQGRGNLCSVCDDDAISGDRGFWPLGERAEQGSRYGG